MIQNLQLNARNVVLGMFEADNYKGTSNNQKTLDSGLIPIMIC